MQPGAWLYKPHSAPGQTHYNEERDHAQSITRIIRSFIKRVRQAGHKSRHAPSFALLQRIE